MHVKREYYTSIAEKSTGMHSQLFGSRVLKGNVAPFPVGDKEWSLRCWGASTFVSLACDRYRHAWAIVMVRETDTFTGDRNRRDKRSHACYSTHTHTHARTQSHKHSPHTNWWRELWTH